MRLSRTRAVHYRSQNSAPVVTVLRKIYSAPTLAVKFKAPSLILYSKIICILWVNYNIKTNFKGTKCKVIVKITLTQSRDQWLGPVKMV
jgi:hypothetical protein